MPMESASGTSQHSPFVMTSLCPRPVKFISSQNQTPIEVSLNTVVEKHIPVRIRDLRGFILTQIQELREAAL